MPENNTLCVVNRLQDSAICLHIAQFLQTLATNAQTTGAAIAVVGIDGELIAFGAHTGCPSLPRQLAPRKAWSALRFRRPTARLAQEVADGTLLLANFNDDRLLAMPGGAPIVVDGAVIAGVGISGLPPDVDARLAESLARQLTAA